MKSQYIKHAYEMIYNVSNKTLKLTLLNSTKSE